MKRGIFCVFSISLILAVSALNGTCWAKNFVVSDIAGLQNALLIAQSNGHADTIRIKAGTYPVATTLTYKPSENYALTIIGEGSGSTILDGGENIKILSIDTSELEDDSEADIYIRKLTFRNGDSYTDNEDDGGGLFVRTTSADITVKDSVFYWNFAFNGGGAFIVTDTGEITFSDNTFHDNHAVIGAGASFFARRGIVVLEGNKFTGNGWWDGHGGGVAATSNSGMIFLNKNYFIENYADFGGGSSTFTSTGKIINTNNIYDGNMGWVFGGGGAFARAGWDNDEVSSIIFTNNTIIRNKTIEGSGGGLAIDLVANNSTADIYNNIIFGNLSYDYQDGKYINDDIDIDDDRDFDNVGAIVNLFSNDYSSLYINVGDHLILGDNINQDPLLSADYRLQENSPCIDAGNNDAPFLPRRDFEGDQRKINRIVDIGADEFRGKQWKSGK
jgi:hypothetical protein